MIKIAHRGNTDGPSETENDPIHLIVAISKGFDVEVDVWMNSEGIFLGHDYPKYNVDETFLQDIKKEAWFHCKNIESLGYFVNNLSDAKFFWHQDDDYTLTSNGYIWTYPGKIVTNKSIVVLKQKENIDIYKDAYAVCSDYLI